MDNYIKSAPSKDLAARIVAYRLLKINKSLAIKCMEELSLREKNGDKFNYNEYINVELEKSPKPYADKSIIDFLKSVSKGNISKI